MQIAIPHDDQPEEDQATLHSLAKIGGEKAQQIAVNNVYATMNDILSLELDRMWKSYLFVEYKKQ